jgi:hypothetical protein
MHMLRGMHRKLRWAGVAVGVPVIVVAMATPALADVTTVGGGAYGAYVNVHPLNAGTVTLGPTPTVALPSGGGGPITNSLASVNVPGYLSTGVLSVATQGSLGSNGAAQSNASVLNVLLGQNGGIASASAVSSSCQSDANGSVGTSLTQFSVLGQPPVNVSPSPNTQVPIPLIGTLIENEQIVNDSSGHAEITVNALHLVLNGLLGTGDVIVSQSHCVAAGPDVLIPIGAVGGLGLASALGLIFIGRQVWHRRRNRNDPLPA